MTVSPELALVLYACVPRPSFFISFSVGSGHPFTRSALIVAVTRNPNDFNCKDNCKEQNQLSKNHLKF